MRVALSRLSTPSQTRRRHPDDAAYATARIPGYVRQVGSANAAPAKRASGRTGWLNRRARLESSELLTQGDVLARIVPHRRRQDDSEAHEKAGRATQAGGGRSGLTSGF